MHFLQLLPRNRGALLCACTLLTALSVNAADDGIDKRARKQGMEKAPALVKSLGLNCTVSDARALNQSRTSPFAGSTFSSSEGGNGGESGSALGGGGGDGDGPSPGMGSGRGMPSGAQSSSESYEVACVEGLGYVITAPKSKNQAAEAINCLELQPPANAPGGSPPSGGRGGALQCQLPGNADQTVGMMAYVVKAGINCAVTKARGIGHNATNALFEVACDDGEGYVMATTAPPDPNKQVQYSACLDLPADASVQCQYTTLAAVLSAVDPLMAKSGKACQITDRRLLGRNDEGDKYFEVSCREGTGYVLQRTGAGELGQVVTCAELGTTAGGCQLAGNKK